MNPNISILFSFVTLHPNLMPLHSSHSQAPFLYFLPSRLSYPFFHRCPAPAIELAGRRAYHLARVEASPRLAPTSI